MLFEELALIRNQTQPKVLIVHRYYRVRGGEDTFLEGSLLPSLKKLGVEFDTATFEPLFAKKKKILSDFLELTLMALGLETLRPSYFTLKKRARANYTHVFFNNWIPTVSLAAPSLFKSQGAKAFYWVHNARVFCANGLNFNGRARCNECVERGSHRVFFNKCYSSSFQNILYSFAYRKSRVMKYAVDQLDGFVPVSDFAKENLESACEKVLGQVKLPSKVVLPFYPQSAATNVEEIKQLPANFYLFLGRLSNEKGVDLFIELARKFSKSTFVIAGDGPMRDVVEQSKLSNLIYLGSVSGPRKEWLLKNSRAIVIPSRAPENAPMVILESEKYGTPIVFSKGGGAQRLVEQLKRPGVPLESFDPESWSIQNSASSVDFTESFLNKINGLLS